MQSLDLLSEATGGDERVTDVLCLVAFCGTAQRFKLHAPNRKESGKVVRASGQLNTSEAGRLQRWFDC